MSDTWITPAMRARIGVESEPYSQVAELGDLVRFARSTGETNPIYFDEAYAKKTPYGGLIAPPSIHILLMFSCTPTDDWMRSPGTINCCSATVGVGFSRTASTW